MIINGNIDIISGMNRLIILDNRRRLQYPGRGRDIFWNPGETLRNSRKK